MSEVGESEALGRGGGPLHSSKSSNGFIIVILHGCDNISVAHWSARFDLAAPPPPSHSCKILKYNNTHFKLQMLASPTRIFILFSPLCSNIFSSNSYK